MELKGVCAEFAKAQKNQTIFLWSSFPNIFESSDIVNVCAISVTNEDDGDSDDSEERVDDCQSTCIVMIVMIVDDCQSTCMGDDDGDSDDSEQDLDDCQSSTCMGEVIVIVMIVSRTLMIVVIPVW